MLKNTKIGHIYHFGGCFSCVEILVYIYFHVFRNTDLYAKSRNRFILSKGHAAFALYTVLALKGYINMEELAGYKEIESRLQGHPDMKRHAAIDFSTASLGQGLSVGVGYALAHRICNVNYRTIVLVGDGEIQEGQIWEAAMCAAKYGLSDLYCIMDYNKYQVDGLISDVMPIENIKKKWESFGWYVIEVMDGHNFSEIDSAFRLSEQNKENPKLIIAHTIKGKGISFMENTKEWHSNSLSNDLLYQALKEVDISE